MKIIQISKHILVYKFIQSYFKIIDIKSFSNENNLCLSKSIITFVELTKLHVLNIYII